MILAALLALAVSAAPMSDDPSVRFKHGVGFQICDSELIDLYGYHECWVETNEDASLMWVHALCSHWDPVKERRTWSDGPVLEYEWDRSTLTRLTEPVLMGCPEQL